MAALTMGAVFLFTVLLKRILHMAILLNQDQGSLKVVLEQDSALRSGASDYKAYLDSGLNENALTFDEGKQPTRFIMRSVLDYDSQQKIMNEQIQMQPDSKGKMSQKFNIGYILSEVRASLTDIENPADLDEKQHIKFTRDSDGKASKKLIGMLHGAGLVMQLFSARSAALTKTEDVELLKKS